MSGWLLQSGLGVAQSDAAIGEDVSVLHSQVYSTWVTLSSSPVGN